MILPIWSGHKTCPSQFQSILFDMNIHCAYVRFVWLFSDSGGRAVHTSHFNFYSWNNGKDMGVILDLKSWTQGSLERATEKNASIWVDDII